MDFSSFFTALATELISVEKSLAPHSNKKGRP